LRGLNGFKVFNLPILKTANIDMKRPMVANIISLGVISKVLDIVNEENILKAVLKRVPPGTDEINKTAFYKVVSMI
jgi:2-oxoglutarate ferredoxin oxidoreductase subunit gamma